MNQNEIFLIGSGWGFECARTGLSKSFVNIHAVDSDEAGTVIQDLRGKTIVFAGFKPIVPQVVVKNNTCINIHYSLLPKYRGLHSTVWAILNDEDFLGLSIHLMNDYIDDGPIIHQYRIKNDRVQTSREYMELFNAYVAKHLGVILENYLNGLIELQKNDKSLATWVGRRNHSDCMLDFNRSISYLKCFFRALVVPYPLPYIVVKGKEYVVTDVLFHSVNVETHIGRILNIDNDGLWVKVNDGYIILRELKDENGHPVPYHNFTIGQYLNQ